VIPLVPRPIGIGCMRLSTGAARDHDGGVAVIHAALDAGVTLLDTADAYCSDQHDVGHNERLIARALATWTGDRGRVLVATKGGLTRPAGAWVPDGRASHLTAACQASRLALGVERIALYQLHAPDPRTPLSTSVRALAALKKAGDIERIGLCNVSRQQIDAARQIADIDSVQVEVNLLRDRELLSGVVEYCAAHGILLIAHRPLAGSGRQRRLARDPLLTDLATIHGVTPQDIALAWLLDLAPVIVPIPGPTHIETASRAAVAHTIRLTDDDRTRLVERVPAVAGVRRPAAVRAGPAIQTATRAELVMILGLPAAGKSTLAETFVAQGYTRLNRDELGGSLRSLAATLESSLDTGATQFVSDNTFATRHARAPLLQLARRLGVQVRAEWLTTAIEDAQCNVVWRMLARYGRILEPAEIKQLSKTDPGVFGPGVLFRYQREFEPPDLSEGFVEIVSRSFERHDVPARTNRGLVIRADGPLRKSLAGHRTPMSVDDICVPDRPREVLQRYAADGYVLIAIGWRPELADGTLTAGVAAEIDRRVAQQLGVPIDVLDCPHPAGPPICWCRTPLPALGVWSVARHHLDAAQSIYCGSGPQDPGFARRCGFQYVDAGDLFGEGVS
jgi:aryl-alcohol dehydrogenase-like predicted oxidoreductase/predicted kinase